MKHFKRALSVLLILCLSLSTLAGCSTSDTPTSEPVQPTESTAPGPKPEEPDMYPEPIFKRARAYGFVPEELWEEPDRIITMSEFCKLLENIIAYWNAEKLDAWHEIAELAMTSADEVQRNEALVAIFEAAIAMDAQARPGGGSGGVMPDWEVLAVTINEDVDWWKGFQNEYPYFPNSENYIDPVWTDYEPEFSLSVRKYAEHHCSLVDFTLIFPPEDNWTFDFGRDVTCKEAIRAATVFAESDATFYDGAAEYVSPADAGTYDTSIITPELLNKETNLPTPTRQSLPGTWRGMGLSRRKDGPHAYNNFKESDIKLLAENGFNFVRLFFNMNTLQFPYKNVADDEVNMVELKELDQLLAWCMEYDVHLQITCAGIQGFSSQGETNMEEMTDRNWEVFVERWKMLGKRYADIPSAYLSFELMNEWHPYEDIDHIAQYFFEAADAIWEANTNRVVSGCTGAIYSEDDYKWLEKLASHGLVLGTHPYYPEQICVRDAYMVYPDEPSWPMPWFPSGIGSGDKITIEGELGDGLLTIYFEAADWPTQVYVYGNGKLLEELDPNYIISEIQSDIGTEPFAKGYDIELPTGTTSVTLRTGDQKVWYNGLKFSKNGVEHGVTANDFKFDNMTGEAHFEIDNTGWHSADGHMYTIEDMFEEKIKPVIDIAEKYNVGVMVNELGCFGNTDLGTVECEYIDDLIRTLAEHGIGWCYCEMPIAGIFNAFQNTDGTVYFLDGPVYFPDGSVYCKSDGYLVYEYEDGRIEKYYYRSDLMEVFRKYTIAE